MIKETIIVEGRDDITAVKAAVECHIIATGGSHFGEAKLKEIEEAHKRTGIIILTDPDYAGLRIREKILKRIPDAKHAYLPRKKAHDRGKAGVEYAKPEAIREALANVQTLRGDEALYTAQDLFTLGLTGSACAQERRRKVCDRLHIGACNGRQFIQRLNGYGISKDALLEALEAIDGE